MKGRCLILNGFFGAGKTEGLIAISKRLQAQGVAVGAVACGAGDHLLDGTVLRMQGLNTEQVSIAQEDPAARVRAAIQNLREGARAEVVLVEAPALADRSINSEGLPCLRLTVVDPFQAAAAIRREGSGPWRDAFLAQLRSAEALFINKIDRLTPQKLGEIQALLDLERLRGEIFFGSFRTGEGLDGVETLLRKSDLGTSIANAARGESGRSFACLNARVELSSARYFDGNAVMEAVAMEFKKILGGSALLHLKLSLSAMLDDTHVSLLNMAAPFAVAETRNAFPEPISAGELVMNVRACSDPDRLTNALTEAINEVINSVPHLFGRIEASEAFWL